MSSKRSITESTSVRLAKMSLLCAVMVVGLHIGKASGICGAVFSQVFVRGIFPIAVPFFFLASGFFLAMHVDEDGWCKAAIRKRVKTVLLPMLIVGVLFELFTLSLTVLANLKAGRELCKNFYVGWEWLRVVGIYPFDYPGMRALWFLRSLMIFVLLSRLIVFVVRKFGVAFLVLMFAVSVFTENCLVTYSPVWHMFCTIFSIRGLFWFSLGMFLTLENSHLRFSNRVGKILGICGLVVPLITCNIVGGGYSIVRYLSVPFVMLGVWSSLSDRRWSSRLLSLSFPIYLLHMFFVDACNCIGLKGDGRLTIYLLLIKYVICISGAAFVAMSLRRFAPRFATLMFGGR